MAKTPDSKASPPESAGLAKSGRGVGGTSAPELPPGMVAAWFTEPELNALRKVVRDVYEAGEGELGKKYLQVGLDRAAGRGAFRRVDEVG